MDNIFTERLWRSVKYKEVYLNVYHDVTRLQQERSLSVSFESVPRQTYEMGLQPWEVGRPAAIQERVEAETTAPEVAAIVVEPSIYSSIQSALNTYVSDVTSRYANVTFKPV